jgi:hypothetical protein
MMTSHLIEMTYLALCLWLYSTLLDLSHFSVFFLSFTQLGGLLGQGSACHKAATCTQDSTPNQNDCTQTSMPQVGFEPMIPVFEWGKTFHALDCVATVIG